ncbi:COG3014 family protein [Photobacterium sp. TY1-4]|uniref:COG3014 family protein n=1 Tax=Photobacterium sp. TY1-4 TaxID=2899122 RepID=UPI0021C17EA6|nr:hypothetical protein [Photobacterium sp. TY1-4]UXI02288.1 hypothetical protein NH461_05785 [Photobacterium sp. TY1-4]
MIKKTIQHAITVGFALALTACANLSPQNLFSHYSAANTEARAALVQGQYQSALESLPDVPAGEILDGMERGRIAYLAGQYPNSFAALNLADEAVKAQQRAAQIQVSEGLNQAGSLLTNDNLITYQPADYELGFLHLYLALNYLQQRDLSGALVEVRRANQVQEVARKEREASLNQAAQAVSREGVNNNLGAVLARYPDAGEQLAAVQNGYLFFLSGLLYEADGDLNSAYIDYKRALAVAPGNMYVANTVLRVASRLQMRADLAQLEARYGRYTPPGANAGRVVILDEQGVVQAREGWRLPLWLADRHGNSVIYNLALPYYPKTSGPALGPLLLNQQSVIGSKLADVNQMAHQSLNEYLPVLVARQALRVVAKNEFRKAAASNGNDVGNLLANIFNTLTEQPDTRSWQSLPAVVDLYQAEMPAGTYPLRRNGESLDVKVVPGRTTLVWVSRQGSQTRWWSVLLGES